MNILVTGGAGYIGSVTVTQLLNRGHEVVVFDNLERGHRPAVDSRASFFEGDLRDRDRVLNVFERVKPEAVVHFAAYALVGESMEKPALYFRNNVGGGIHLVEGMLSVGTRSIVFSSTCAVYGLPQQVPITEKESCKPANPYGESKRMFEVILEWHARRNGIRPVFLRYFNAAGASGRRGEDHNPETHLIPNVLKVALGQAPAVSIFGTDYETPDGTCIRDYIHIEDLAQAHIRALETEVVGAFNLGNGSGYSVRQVIETARAVTGHPIPTRIAPRRPGDPPVLVADASRAKRELGWVPQIPDLADIIRSAWEWARQHPRGYAG